MSETSSKPAAGKRTEWLKIRLSASEKKAIEKNAAAAKQSVSDFVRLLAGGEVVKAVLPPIEKVEFMGVPPLETGPASEAVGSVVPRVATLKSRQAEWDEALAEAADRLPSAVHAWRVVTKERGPRP